MVGINFGRQYSNPDAAFPVFIVLFLLSNACSMQTLTDANNGSFLDLKVGEKFQVNLPRNATTGYTWEIESTDTIRLALTDEMYDPGGNGLGAGGLQKWTFEALQPGHVTLRMKYWQPWSGEDSVEKRFEITLEIH